MCSNSSIILAAYVYFHPLPVVYNLETSRKASTRIFIIRYEWLWILLVFTKYLPCGSVFSLTSRRAILLPDLLFDWQRMSAVSAA